MGSSSSTAAAATSYGVPTTGPSSSTAATSYVVKRKRSSPCAYEVFLSFRGADIRKTFIDHLFKALEQHGIYTFKDDKRLERGESVPDQLSKAIEQSRSAIIVFSKGYASSPWCLDELEKIMDCKEKLGLAVYPVFYDVPPSDVRGQRGTFGKGFAKAIERNPDQEDVWRKALRDAANLSGYDVQNTADGHESQSIKQIVKWFWDNHGNIVASFDEDLIGINSRVQKLVSLLGIDSVDDVKMIGIWGMGGAGKTTLATAVFDEIRTQFDGASFIESVRENSQKLGLPQLQKTILSNILKDGNLNVNRVPEGTQMLRTRLGCKKVLIVLDDVDDLEQLWALARDRNWFGKGSRILITTRDEHLLVAHGIDKSYNVDLLDEIEAMQLFRRHAFKKHSLTQGYDELSLEIARYAAGLPLTLKVLGALVCGSGKAVWIDVLERLKKSSEEKTFEILKISYDSLKVDEKDLFLDIACFFKGGDRERAIKVLESQGYHTKIGISTLQQKCLITVSDDGKLQMHDLIVEMGRKIVSDSDPKEPGKRSRLWHDEEIVDVLENNKLLYHLKFLNLSRSRNLIRTPDFSGIPNLIELKLSWCISLVEVHSSLGGLQKLVLLDLSYCKNLVEFPSNIRMKSLEILNLYGCCKFKRFPEIWGNMDRLSELRLNDTAIEGLPSSIANLTNLVSIDLGECEDLLDLPDTICMLKNLKEIKLDGCKKLRKLPENLGHIERLEELDLSGSGVKVLPSSIGHLKNLRHVSFTGPWESISEVDSMASINESLEELDVSTTGVEVLSSSIVHLSKGKELLDKLNIVNLSNSEKLIRIPDFSAIPNLKELNLFGCKNLIEVHPSIGDLQKLILLDLGFCKNLVDFPSSIHMKSLEKLNFSGCWKFNRFPELRGNMDRLSKLPLDGTAIEGLPSSIANLTKLISIDLTGCEDLLDLPDTISTLENLKTINLRWCKKLGKLPENLGHIESLEELDLSGSGVQVLPSSIGHLKNLRYMSFSGRWESISEVVSMTTSIGSCLKVLKLNKCRAFDYQAKLIDVGHLSFLETLDLSINGFAFLPFIISQLPRLKILNLTCCQNLKALPELPSSIAILKADRCTSLECIESLSAGKQEWLWNISLKDCESLIMHEKHDELYYSHEKENSFYTGQHPKHYKMLPSLQSMLQGHTVINHRLSIHYIEGSVDAISKWFGQEMMEGGRFILKLPSNWQNEITGFAMCIVFDGPVLGISLGISLSEVGRQIPVHAKLARFPVDGYYDVWKGYISLKMLQRSTESVKSWADWMDTATQLLLTFSLKPFVDLDSGIGSCAARVVCMDEVENSVETTLSSSFICSSSNSLQQQYDPNFAAKTILPCSKTPGTANGITLDLET